MSRGLSNLDIVGLYYVLIVVKGLLQGVGDVLVETLNNQGVVNVELEAMLSNV